MPPHQQTPSSPFQTTTFATQANALFRKNITFQKRNAKTNCCIISFPIGLCLLLLVLQVAINIVFNGSDFKCGCQCVPVQNGTAGCETKCGIQYSSDTQAGFCALPSPPQWPAFLQLPAPEYRAVQQPNSPFQDLPSPNCRADESCSAAFLYTGKNKSVAQDLATLLFQTSDASRASNSSDLLEALSTIPAGTSTWTAFTNYIEPAILYPQDTYVLLPSCSAINNVSVTVLLGTEQVTQAIRCVQSNVLWRDNYDQINDELYEGFRGGNPNREINEVSAAFDFGSTSAKIFDVVIAYNRTYKNDSTNAPPALLRVARSMNLAAQAFLRRLQPDAELPLLFVSEMPKGETKLRLDFASIIGPLFYMWVVQLLLPVILTALVYEKQYNLRMMMKMHGLGDGPYWLISYSYFLALSIIYMFFFVLFGSVIDLKFFRLNSYSIQFVFFFIYINLQIALGFLGSTTFSNVRTATVFGYIYVFGFGLLGEFLFRFFLEDTSFSKGAIFAMELVPGFSLYRGLYEFSQYAFIGNYKGTDGMRWNDVNDSVNGIKDSMGIMAVEWFLFLLLAYYLDKVLVSGSGLKKSPFFFLKGISRRFKSKNKYAARMADSPVSIDVQKQDMSKEVNIEISDQKPDVSQERKAVQEALSSSEVQNTILCDELKKVYPGRDGNPPKYAVKGLSLAIARGECFGMLGPNGAGKTTSISMMTGLLAPTSGTVYIEGLDLSENLDKIYSCMGVCPQHDLLWETLTGREHLLFYGRLKNLKNEALKNAVDEALRSVNLFNGGVGDKQAGKYSGGMKRRLSVAISLIGNPKVVYMDEPSTGLDPASRSNLWDVVRRAKRDRAIILTTHSMEEAETLCDRLGIFVNGELQCIGNSKQLKSRFGGSFVFSITTAQSEENSVLEMVHKLSRNAKKIYGLSGTQKFELPKSDVSIADVFRTVEHAKTRFSIQAWGLADTTLEDVFITVANEASNGQEDLS